MAKGRIEKSEGHHPLRVTITLRPGGLMREPTHLIHLDALLAYVRVQESIAEGAQDYSAQENLPLSKLRSSDDENHVWAASCLTYDVDLKEERYWSRKTNIERILEAKESCLLRTRLNKVNTGSGPWKGYSEFESLLHVKTLTAWCIGQREEVESLLSELTHIGKRRSKGYGEIDSVLVENCEDALDKVFLRVLSFEHNDDYHPMRCGVRPPYFEVKDGFYPSKRVFRKLLGEPYM